METAIRLLMRDGAVEVRFRPRLTAEQYNDLEQVTKEPGTKEELRDILTVFARFWDVEVMCDDAI